MLGPNFNLQIVELGERNPTHFSLQLFELIKNNIKQYESIWTMCISCGVPFITQYFETKDL